MENSISLPAGFSEIRVKGKTAWVPSVELEGRTIIATGKYLKIATIRDEDVVSGELVSDPDTFVANLRNSALKADLFTFFQRPPDLSPKFNFHFEWDNYAAVPITSYDDWWNALSQETRKNVRRAAKRGVTTRAVAFDDELARGIYKLCNEAPVRQGKPFWHFGKDFDTVKDEHSTYLGRSEFIGAYFENELIGFIKMVYVDQVAFIFHILAANAHYDKRPINALIAAAVEKCAEKKIRYFVHDRYSYGNKSHSSLLESKRRNGFIQINFPRYYIPLTWKGKIALAFRLYRGLSGLLPGPILQAALAVRNRFYERKSALNV
jgi:hypothetical protein